MNPSEILTFVAEPESKDDMGLRRWDWTTLVGRPRVAARQLRNCSCFYSTWNTKCGSLALGRVIRLSTWKLRVPALSITLGDSGMMGVCGS
jgi:hypothetical protein